MTVFDPFRQARGFTFLEIMVSLAILSLTLVTLFYLQSGSIGLTGAAEFNRISPLLARQQLSVVLGQDHPDTNQGDFTPWFPGYTWTVEIVEPEIESAMLTQYQAKRLRQIRIQVNSPQNKYQFQLQTLRYLSADDAP